MNTKISDAHLSRFGDFVQAKMGLHCPRQRWLDLERGVAAAASEFGFDDVPMCMEWLMSAELLTKGQIEILASHLTVGETYFFRERQTFEILANRILPSLISARRGNEQQLRIWSAACCTGEEPYSLAILLHQTIPDLHNWNVTILATDINSRFLRKAVRGIYGQWSFRDTSGRNIDRYFTKTPDGQSEVVPEIKRLVRFAHLNLVDDIYPSLVTGTNAMDLILCRNVLMYFGRSWAEDVVRKLYRAQAEGGWLAVSPSEVSQTLFHPYITVNFPGAVFYQKDESQSRLAASCWPVTEGEPTVREQVANIDPAALQFRAEWHEEATAAESVRETEATDCCSLSEGAALYEQGRYAEASEKLRTLASGASPQAEAFNLLARALANQGKLAEALDWCEQGIAADKLNASAYYLRALVLQEKGAVDNAVDALQRALYLKQDFVLAHFALANLARVGGKTTAAARHFANALDLLRSYPPEAVLPESDGITASRLTEIVTSLMNTEIR
jgi:chemotaxis protein methyltransferase CheR